MIHVYFLQNTGNKFSIDPSSGEVIVDERLDFETQVFYPLIVRATVSTVIFRNFDIYIIKLALNTNLQ